MQWRYFNYNVDTKLACSCCGARLMDYAFMRVIDELRHAWGAPLAVTSGYRCSKYNVQVSSTGPFGPHTTGRAIDLRLAGGDVRRFLKLIPDKITGVGFAQKGNHAGRFVHLDNLPNAPGQPRPWVWTY